MNVKDTEIIIGAGRISPTCKTKRPISRLTDGLKHPVKVTKVSPEEMKRLWNKPPSC